LELNRGRKKNGRLARREGQKRKEYNRADWGLATDVKEFEAVTSKIRRSKGVRPSSRGHERGKKRFSVRRVSQKKKFGRPEFCLPETESWETGRRRRLQNGDKRKMVKIDVISEETA